MSTSEKPDYDAWRSLIRAGENVFYLPKDRREIVWFQPSGPSPRFPVLRSELDAYNTTAMYSSPPAKLPRPVRFALIGRIPHRAFNLDADACCATRRVVASRAEGQGSAELEDLEALVGDSEFKRGWNQLGDIASAALPGHREFNQAHGLLSVHNALPTLELRHNFFKVRCCPLPQTLLLLTRPHFFYTPY